MAPDRRPRYLALVLIALALLRWWLATTPGYPPDLHAYKVWALQSGLVGIQTVYDTKSTLYDYPPLYAYLLAPIGRLYGSMAPEAVRDFPRTFLYGDSPTFSILVKLPPLLFDILMALLLARIARRWGLWRRKSWLGWLPALLYLGLPPALIDSGHWGQPDVVHTFWVLLGLTLILRGRPEWGWVCAGLACLMKPLAVPFLPLLALATLVRWGWWRSFRAGAAGLATILAGFLPFLLTGRAAATAQRVLLDVDVMNFTSVNGHNLWMLVKFWYPADQPLLGPLSYGVAAQILFGAAYLYILWTAWNRERGMLSAASAQTAGSGAPRFPIGRGGRPLHGELHWYLAAACVASAFFTLSTHMHENHAFALFPLLILLAGESRGWFALLLVAAFSIGINMLTHDILLANNVWSKIGGDSGYYHPDNFRTLSWLELVAMKLNSLVTIGICGTLLVALRRFRPSAGDPRASVH
jgi:4-amino-4-deoxy-L-arabinose transferase-like glycosyltransferase